MGLSSRVKTGHLMNFGIVGILCVASVACCPSVRAEDTVDQAAARAAMEQKFHELDHLDAGSGKDANAATPLTQPVESTAGATATASPAPAPAVPVDSNFMTSIPAANSAAQAAALAAVEEKMNDLNRLETGSIPDAHAAGAAMLPANEASASATPLTESPDAEVPEAIAPVAVAPVSVAPAVVPPAPIASTAPVRAAAVVPAVGSGVKATPARLPAAALPASSAGLVRPSNELVTATGATYKNVEVQKVTSDGIVISYTPAHGGWAMTKVYFRDLPSEIRRQYGKP
jgi:hypothetical protein